MNFTYNKNLFHYACISFGKSNPSREETLEFLKKSDKPILYTFGLAYRDPNIRNEPVTKEWAINQFEEEPMTDVDEYDDHIGLNSYSSDDLY